MTRAWISGIGTYMHDRQEKGGVEIWEGWKYMYRKGKVERAV